MFAAVIIAACAGCGADLGLKLVGEWECAGLRRFQIEQIEGEERAEAFFEFKKDGGYHVAVGARLTVGERTRERAGEVKGAWRPVDAIIAFSDRESRDKDQPDWRGAPDRSMRIVEITERTLSLQPIGNADGLLLECDRATAADP